jgi:hypothetical protein
LCFHGHISLAIRPHVTGEVIFRKAGDERTRAIFPAAVIIPVPDQTYAQHGYVCPERIDASAQNIQTIESKKKSRTSKGPAFEQLRVTV